MNSCEGYREDHADTLCSCRRGGRGEEQETQAVKRRIEDSAVNSVNKLRMSGHLVL